MVQYGWAEKGVRSYAEQASFRRKRLSIIAGYEYGSRSIVAPFEYEGYTDTEIFNLWFIQELLPNLKAQQVVILDNASFHKSPLLAIAAKERGIKIIYLPAYSPDLNPIEKFWANLKHNIRKIIKKCRDLQEAIAHAFEITISG